MYSILEVRWPVWAVLLLLVLLSYIVGKPGVLGNAAPSGISAQTSSIPMNDDSGETTRARVGDNKRFGSDSLNRGASIWSSPPGDRRRPEGDEITSSPRTAESESLSAVGTGTVIEIETMGHARKEFSVEDGYRAEIDILRENPQLYPSWRFERMPGNLGEPPGTGF